MAAVVVMARRSDQPWAGSFRLYVWVGVVIVVVRVVFRIVFGGGEFGTVLIDLPRFRCPTGSPGIRLFGPVTPEAVLAGLYDGLRLATHRDLHRRGQLAGQPQAAAPVGAAGALRDRHRPRGRGDRAPAVRRQRAPGAGAQSLRAGDTGRVGRLRRLLVPVLEDALERSLALAAGMDTRGYGRAGRASTRRSGGAPAR